MSHTTEIQLQTADSTFTTQTGSRRLAEYLGLKVQEEGTWLNQNAVDCILQTKMDTYLSLNTELVLKMLVQDGLGTLAQRVNEIQDLKEHSYSSIEEKECYQHHANRLEAELNSYPVFKLTIKHLD